MYSVKAAAHHTGLSAETLRAWERRYGAVRPERDRSGRRSYSQEDLLRLQLLHSATDLGHPIRKVARLDNAQLRKLIGSADTGSADERAGERLAQQMIDAAMAYRHEQCEHALCIAMALLPPRDVIHHVAGPALRRIGEMWHAGESSVAQERVMSSSVRRVFDSVIGHFRKAARGRPLLFATLAGEQHDLGSLMAAFYAATLGFDCRYLGDGLPPEELARAASGTESAGIGLSIVLPDLEPPVQEQLAALCRIAPKDCEIWAGGRTARTLDGATLGDRFVRLSDVDDFERHLRLLLA